MFNFLGDILGFGSNIITNDTNRDIANTNNYFNADQAQKNRDYQTQMSNTAHQREVKDLRAAGLNPLLSANTGASSPGGATASSSGNPTMRNVFEGTDIGGHLRDMVQMENQTQSTQADVRVKDAQAAATISNTKMDPSRKALMLQQIEESKFRSKPNSIDQLLTRYLDRFSKYVESGARKEGSDMRRATQNFIRNMKPEDWSKLQNSIEGTLKGGR